MEPWSFGSIFSEPKFRATIARWGGGKKGQQRFQTPLSPVWASPQLLGWDVCSLSYHGLNALLARPQPDPRPSQPWYKTNAASIDYQGATCCIRCVNYHYRCVAQPLLFRVRRVCCVMSGERPRT